MELYTRIVKFLAFACCAAFVFLIPFAWQSANYILGSFALFAVINPEFWKNFKTTKLTFAEKAVLLITSAYLLWEVVSLLWTYNTDRGLTMITRHLPLFAMPCPAAGLSLVSVLVSRFAIASATMVPLMRHDGCDLRISLSDFWRITLLALLNVATAVLLIWGYDFMASGPATTIQFSYPVFTCLLMTLLCGERMTLRNALAIALAVAGVACLSGWGCFSWQGVVIELLAGLSYAVYLVLVPRMALGHICSTKLAFYIFVVSTVQLLAVSAFTGGVDAPPSWLVAVCLLLLGVVPTAVSNYTLILGLKSIGSTLTSILGALEPLTAMAVGVAVFGEPLTWLVAIGVVAVIAAVIILVTSPSASCYECQQQ